MHETKPRPYIPEGSLPGWKTYGKEIKELVPGFPMLAGEMEQSPETAIFRRFASLNARNLLYLQQELIDMENRLKQLEYRDSVSDKGWRKHYAKNSASLRGSIAFDDPAQWTLMLQIREKLKEYNKTLVYQSLMYKLPRPDDYDVTDIRNFIYSTQGMSGPFNPKEVGPWGTPQAPNHHAPDLITLRPRKKEDQFSSFISEKAIRYIQWPLSRLQSEEKRVRGMVVYHDSTVLKITYSIIGILAGLAPILSILVLTKLHTLKARLWTIAMFNVGIALSLQLFTEAKRTDIFAVTAA
ncbi:hypothetical protein P171DRAFT_369901 [Karstenula rhodostoma CBS 690.94]|uniref:DUF6594 domain-containing protein n=1 Tax=Karstenula rhodostoma CBS 690.94 TaxID=1392251 RepID=A0A9P4P9S0_9PLEO|nr:hypothetical protein P171DRAFT_369901 [Karstenula rhodostoma CBS 690.94]